MEALGAGASCFAVISLAIQLVETVRDVRRFLQSVSEAPGALKRLIDQLEQLELILESIKSIVERPRIQNGGQETVFSTHIFRAMRLCQERINLLVDVVDNATSPLDGRGKRATKKALVSFKLACKKEEIENFERQLQDALRILDITLTLNLTDVHSANTCKVLGEVRNVTDQFTLLRADIAARTQSQHYIPSKNEEPARRQRQQRSTKIKSTQMSRRQTRTTNKYQTLLGTFYYRQESAFAVFDRDHEELSKNVLEHSETSWAFIPTFLSRCIELHRRNVFGCLSTEIRTYRVLPDDHPVFEMCTKGDVRNLQASFCDRSITPFVVSSGGDSLLHLAVQGQQFEVCDMLLKLDVWKREVVNAQGHEPLWYLRCQSVSEWNSQDGILRLFSSRQTDVLERTPSIFFWKEFSASEFKALTGEWVNEDNINIFVDSPLVCGLKCMWKSSPDSDDNEWKSVFQRLMKIGADVHRFSKELGRSLLDDILCLTDCPFESQSLVRLWIQVISSSDIDIERYLDTEMSFRTSLQNPFLPSRDDRQRIILFSPNSPTPIQWEWYISSTSHAYDVLEEFKNFGPPAQNLFVSEFHALWGAVDNWPFVYSEWHKCVADLTRDQERGFGMTDCWRGEVVRRCEGRWERRLEKRGWKFARRNGNLRQDGRRVPGAWVD